MLTRDEFVNPFTAPGKWYKANLHTHTTTSDGTLSVDEVVEKYAAAGYDVLALTDHYKTNDISAYASRKDMLVLSGMECHPGYQPNALYHIVAINVPRDFTFDKLNPPKCVEQIFQAGGVAIMAHPYWSGHDLTEMIGISGVAAMEIYNGVCDIHGRAESSSEWSQCLHRGFNMVCVASDDTHQNNAEDMFQAWTWLKMESPTPENVVNAIKTGACYASCGPEIMNFRIEGDVVKIDCSPAARITFMALAGGQGCRARAENDKLLTHFEVALADIKSWLFVRSSR